MSFWRLGWMMLKITFMPSDAVVKSTQQKAAGPACRIYDPQIRDSSRGDSSEEWVKRATYDSLHDPLRSVIDTSGMTNLWLLDDADFAVVFDVEFFPEEP